MGVPTRFWPNQQPTGLDHYFTSNPRKLSDIQVIANGSSDHRIIFATRFSRCISRKPRLIKKRSYKNCDAVQFLAAIRKISWWRIYSCNEINVAVEILTEEITSILDKMAPIKLFQVRTNYAPWLTANTKTLMQQRDSAQKKANETNLDDDWRAYKGLRNRINNILKTEKKTWQSEKLKEAAGDVSKTWNSVKSWLGWSTGGPPTQLFENGLLLNKPSCLARCMNEFFINKVLNLRANLPPSNMNPLELLRNLMKNRKCSFYLKPVDPDEIEKIISGLKSTKSCGLDNIDSFVIKLAKNELVPAITHIVNLSISQETFPKAWKNAKIIPLHKKNERTEPKNYCPVALLSILSKIMEKSVFQQVIKYMETNHLLHPSHHGFRKSHSTTTALLEMYDTWLEAFEDNKISAVVMLDLSAAFDVVDSSILLDKLELYGFRGNALSWLHSYLDGRQQQVYVDGVLSDPLEVEVGLPQGSILGPLLYIIFTNDLPEVVHNHEPQHSNNQDSLGFYNVHCDPCGSICCFADDSTFSHSDKDPEVLQANITTKYKDIANYMAMNKLFLNSDKTHLLVITSAQQHAKHNNFGIQLNTGSETIQPSNDERLLGAQVSNNFNCNSHIVDNDKSMIKMITSRINALMKVSWSADFMTRKMIGNAIVMSRIVYLVQVYGNASEYLLKGLQILQNKAARVVTRLPWGTETGLLLNQVGWLSVRQLVAFHSLILVFKIKTENKPAALKLREVFVCSSTIMWNTLPPQLRKTEKLEKFKLELKKWVKTNVKI